MNFTHQRGFIPLAFGALTVLGCTSSILAAADFNGDGFDDLAIAVADENNTGLGNAGQGAVHVVYGSADGLSAAGSQRWRQNSPGIPGAPKPGGRFGASIAWGDFNQDGFDDLAISAAHETVNGNSDAGAVHVLYGSIDGLTAEGNQFWTQDSPGVPGAAFHNSLFGGGLGVGDFNGDGLDDLAIRARRAEGAGTGEGGILHILYGDSAGLSAAGAQIFSHDALEAAGWANFWGGEPDSGDFNGDGFDDLFISAVTDHDGGELGGTRGIVHVIYGSPAGLTLLGNQIFHEQTPGIPGIAEANDKFGVGKASGDFDGDGFDDLAVGIVYEDSGGLRNCGLVHVLHGGVGGLTTTGLQSWHQDKPGMLDQREQDDLFGSDLAAADFDGDGLFDLAIGAMGENIGGAVCVLYGSDAGLTAAGDQLWSQDSSGILNSSEPGDNFGSSLTQGDFDGNGRADLVIGVPWEDIGDAANAGLVHVLYSGSSGLRAAGNQVWHQNSPGIGDLCEDHDRFGGF